MASVTSLGIHKPSAIPFLVEEGTLPADPSEEKYTWRTGADIGLGDDDQDEELLTTKHSVVWSRAGTIHRIFRLDPEEEVITKALFTNFPPQHLERDSLVGKTNAKADERLPASQGASKDRQITTRGNERLAYGLPSTIRRPQNQALVIILKTQAHIYFVTGTSHIIHLPFEIDTAFPLPHGILLQRTSQPGHDFLSTPRMPPAPENTFEMSRPRNSSPLDLDRTGTTIGNKVTSPFSTLIDNLQQDSKRHSTTQRSGLLCLIDPLNEVGTVITKTSQRIHGSSGYQSSSQDRFGHLDHEDQLIYASARDELAQTGWPSGSPLTLAVTQHRTSGKIVLWTVHYTADRDSFPKKSPSSEKIDKRYSRRQSFHGTDTGTTTPRARGVGRNRDNAAASQDHAFHSGPVNQDPDILDVAFEDPMKPTKSSRRVSSLLARVDLAATNDGNLFSDPHTSHGKRTLRRGISLGPHSSTIITDIDVGGTFWVPKPLTDIRSSMDSVTLSDTKYAHDVETEFGEIRGANEIHDNSALPSSSGHLCREVLLQKDHSTAIAATPSTCFGAERKFVAPKVFALMTPNNNLGSSTEAAIVTVFIADHNNLLTLRIEAVRNMRKKRTKNNEDYATAWEIFNVSDKKIDRVLDVCSFSEGDSWRVMTLSESSSGIGELSMQTPWSNAQNIELPSPLNVHNPFWMSIRSSSRHRQEGGFRRVLSRGPEVLTSLEHGNSRGQVDVLANNGLRHRLYIQLRPQDPHVLRIIDVCHAILPSASTRQEPILQAWCNVVSWLRSCGEEVADLEWTAIIVVLFTMATPFIPNRHAEGIKQPKRRKGGFLRSSSGANSEMGSWETMISQEHDLTSTTPAWMAQGPWKWVWKEEKLLRKSPAKKRGPSSSQSSLGATSIAPKSSHLLHCIELSHKFTQSLAGQSTAGQYGCLPTSPFWDLAIRRTALASTLIALHLLREEYKLNVLARESLHKLTPVLAQIGGWLGWQNWSCNEGSTYMSDNTDMESWLYDNSVITSLAIPSEPFPPPCIFRFIESSNLVVENRSFVSLVDVASPPEVMTKEGNFGKISLRKLLCLTPRTVLITSLLGSQSQENIDKRIENVASSNLTHLMLETLPESVAVSFRTIMMTCQSRPSSAWGSQTLGFIGRNDFVMLDREEISLRAHGRLQLQQSNESSRDVHSICHTAFEVEMLGPYDGSAEIDRQLITRLLFHDDQRFAEAAKLVHPLLYPIARCAAEPDWSDTDHLEAQQELVKTIVIRTLSVSLGRGLMFYDARMPMLTEKFPIHGFTLSCTMRPGDTTVTADRTAYSEEKVSWAFFHAGVEAGLSISKRAKGVNTSWILFNKPRDLNNRHAGFLLAMGLNGHLRSIAKWVAFKYLTPKHSMTSVGLLLGLAAAFIGTMDTSVIRLLSVHVTRMLPVGAAELNVSPLTQTSGIMGIGLLYCNTQHRRMSEIMLSEMEIAEQEESSNPLESLRDEGYRLAAGFALGFINLARGKDLKGLHDMHVTERLLALAIAAKRADRIHILDRATAGATIAMALIFMKSHDKALARKIDIPDTPHQFEYLRPDHFLLRTVAKHLIMWDEIRATRVWMKQQVPTTLRAYADLTSIRRLTSESLPLLNIVAGLCLAVGLRNAGSGQADVRNLLCHYLDQLMRICRLPTLNYDGKLALITVRNCQDVVALSAACVMAGTGDIQILRRLRSLHGRTDSETPYGSHLATHFAIGVLFLGGGTHTLGTSNLAIASLLCAFYPLFPTTVLDNKSHLQAFRHFWVLATERRCLIAREVDNLRPVSIQITVKSLETNAQITLKTPCLLPPLETIAAIQTNDPEYWPVTLDFSRNPAHLAAFHRHQSIFLRRRAPYDAHLSSFSATMQALNDYSSPTAAPHTLSSSKQSLFWIFSLPAFRCFNRADQTMLLPANASESVYQGTRGTVLDDRLVFESIMRGVEKDEGPSERLWNLRILFAWAQGRRKRGEEEGGSEGKEWIAREIIEKLRVGIVLRRQRR